MANTELESVTMEKCNLIRNKLNHLTIKDVHLTGCELDDSQWTDIIGDLIDKEFQFNHTNEGTHFSNTGWKTLQDEKISKPRPTVVLLYSPADGVANTDLLVRYYREKGMDIQLIGPQDGINHPIFQNTLICGIILPGGPDVPKNQDDPRLKFEIEALNFARDKKIPLLAICRGHQFVGSQYGGTIGNVINDVHKDKAHDHRAHPIIVKNKKKYGSDLYNHLKAKHEKFRSKSKEEVGFTLSNENTIQYLTACRHNQRLFFEKNRNNKANVKIVAKAVDGTPEALEIDNHIMTVQHHHEIRALDFDPKSKVAKSVLNLFVKKVNSYYEKHRNDQKNELKR